MSATPETESALFIGAANALAGACGGVSAMTLIYPLDVIRCRLQAQADALSKRASIIEENDLRFSVGGMESIDESNEVSRQSPEVVSECAVDEVMRSINRTIQDDRRKQRSSISNCIQDIMKEEGFSGFYKALDTQLVGIFYSDIVYFFTVTFLKQYLYGKREVSPIANLKASTLAGVFNVLFTLPYWTVQTQLMLQKKKKNNANGSNKSSKNSNKNSKNSKNKSKSDNNNGNKNNKAEDNNCGECCEMGDNKEKSDEYETELIKNEISDVSDVSDDINRDYKGFLDGFMQILRKQGLNGFYKGLGPSLLLVTNPIIQFVSYEEMIKVLKYYQKIDQLSNLAYFVCGAMAKSLATLITYPLQVMKTQLQKRDSKFNNMQECVRFLSEKLQKGDLRPLYSGLAAKLWQTVLNSAIKYMIYERVLEIVLTLLRRLRKMLVVAIFAKNVKKAVK